MKNLKTSEMLLESHKIKLHMKNTTNRSYHVKAIARNTLGTFPSLGT